MRRGIGSSASSLRTPRIPSICRWLQGQSPPYGMSDPCSDEFLKKLSYMPSDVDIWGATVLPYDMGEEYASFFSKLLGTSCKLGYVNTARPRYIRGHLPPPQCQNGKHPQTGLSDGAPYLYHSPPPPPFFFFGWLIRGGYARRTVWRILIREWKCRCRLFGFDLILWLRVVKPLMRIIGRKLRLGRVVNFGYTRGRRGKGSPILL